MATAPKCPKDKIRRTEAEWKAALTPEQFRVARKRGTERAFTSPYQASKAAGSYACVCCGAPLFGSGDKFDSGTGWPSFVRPVQADAVETQADWSFLIRRTEVRCAACEAHLGHVFKDGPRPTGLRYCINGAALTFRGLIDEAAE